MNQHRLLAKARFREQTQGSARPSEESNNNGKRPIRNSNSQSNTSQGIAGPSKTTNASALKPLPNLIGKFVDYDLTTMKNSKGGFLHDSEEDDARALKQRKQIEELKKQRMKQAAQYANPTKSMNPADHPKCRMCGTIELDFQLFKVFGVPICPGCRNENPDKFSLLTKTECKEDYLLTDPELKDTELLPHLLKANPHQSTYSNMMLYLREQVEAYAFSDKKWGSAENLDVEFERREVEKRKKKNKKFEDRLKDLRKKTRSNVWHRRQEEVHQHDFVDGLTTNDDGVQVQKCKGCGLETECETF
ncbi:hypothetical protein CROQUDRAFT_50165 [Cronartium quercuum f. sp. fusiforme G11]|uniref:DNA repair protein RAD14 n=1 Tax=Cronartium quercuum f. sp. fusiforme G11 TaxID=708437 RepID=A0A9P6T7Y0_9BASI|nr:hypothetical protein CROQUDRAFT_50165 [Cronartium quercuum f. sp. fusiforme G11]